MANSSPSSATSDADALSFAMLVDIITIKLSSTNYLPWRNQMLSLLSSQNMIDYVNGSNQAPVQTITVENGTVSPNPEYFKWWTTDQRIMLLIQSSLTEETKSIVLGCETSAAVWTALENAFGSTSEQRALNIRTVLSNLQKGTRSVSEFGREFKQYCDQLAAMQKPAPETEKSHWFLEGLGVEFARFSAAAMQTAPLQPFSNLLPQAEGFEISLKSVVINPHATFNAQTSRSRAPNQPAPIGAISISQLSNYLRKRDFGTSMDLTWHPIQKNDQVIWKRQNLPWNGLTCLSIVCYALKFGFNPDHKDVFDTVKKLNDLAIKDDEDACCVTCAKDPSVKLGNERKIAETFVDNFIPKVKKFFVLQKADEDLAGFVYFLLQILNSETENVLQRHDRSVSLRVGLKSLHQELTFLLAVIGDTPFQQIRNQQVGDLLTEFETVANEAGSKIYSCVFRICPAMSMGFGAWFRRCTCDGDIVTLSAGINVLLERIHLLKEEIERHCSIPPNAMNTTSSDAPDSLFIVESLLEDLRTFNNSRQDELTALTSTLREEIWYAARFLKRTGREVTEELKRCVMRIRDLAYEAEYLINSVVVRNLPEWYACIRIPNVIEKLRNVRNRVEEIRSLNLEDAPLQIALHAPVPTHVANYDNVVVGFERETDAILWQLVGGSEGLEIISIFGMPGCGKTTLAKKLYSHGTVTGYFYKTAWCVVSQTYSRKKVLTDVLLCLDDSIDPSNMDEISLTQNLHQRLMGNKYLIVFDDVWDSVMWNDIGRFFNPPDNAGSRIMFTTRMQDLDVAINYVHELPLLKPRQCWELFERKVFGDVSLCPQQLRQVGERIVAKCGGLPFALVVVAGMLANIVKERDVWEQVEQNLYNSDTFASNCEGIMELSYRHLPNHLKLCFLYMGVFPEDEEIPMQKLISLWISEGLVQKDENKIPEDVAEEYLMDLIHRSLVLVDKKGSRGRVKSCILHDLLRDMCVKRAENEMFMGLIKDDRSSIYKSYHRLHVDIKAPPHLRPVSVKYRSISGYLSDPSSCIPQMKLLRVMKVSPNDKLKNLDLLVHLRYLVVNLIPPSRVIGNLVNLEVLLVENDPSEAAYIPPVLLNMTKLRRLCIDFRGQFEDGCANSQPNSLQYLSSVHIHSNDRDREVLESLTNLRKLKCVCPRELPNFFVLTKLESLRIGVHHTLETSPNNTRINFPSTIKKLCLFRTHLPWERMSVLGRLPELEVLKLLWGAFKGEKWETNEDEFRNLRVLKLAELNLKQWVSKSEHFPRLRHIELHKCSKLQEIPSDFFNIGGLKKIEVHDCSQGVGISAVEIEQEQREYYGGGDLIVDVFINQIRAKSKWSPNNFPNPKHQHSRPSRPSPAGYPPGLHTRSHTGMNNNWMPHRQQNDHLQRTPLHPQHTMHLHQQHTMHRHSHEPAFNHGPVRGVDTIHLCQMGQMGNFQPTREMQQAAGWVQQILQSSGMEMRRGINHM